MEPPNRYVKMSRHQASGTPAYGSDRGKGSTLLIRFDGVLSGGEVRSDQNRDERGARDNGDEEGLNISIQHEKAPAFNDRHHWQGRGKRCSQG